MIKKGPPAATQWQGQQQKSKPAVGPSNQQQSHSGSGGAQASSFG